MNREKVKRAGELGPHFLPRASEHLAAGWLVVLVWCKAQHQAPADLQAISNAGQGDRPLKDLKFKCRCGSRLTDAVVMSRDALAVQPWRGAGEDSTSSAAEHLRGQRPWSAE